MRLLRTASFTLLALVAFVLLAEGAARLLDPLFNHALAREDPFVGQWGLTPVFVPDPADPNYLVTNPKKNGAFRAQRLPRRKLSGEFRILALGGSDTHGFPYTGSSNDDDPWPARLERLLRETRPGPAWRVVNLGGVSYGASRLAIVLNEALALDPDVVLVSTGNNEFSDFEVLREASRLPPAAIEAKRRLYEWRSYVALAKLVRAAQGWIHSIAHPEKPDLFDALGRRVFVPEPVAQFDPADAEELAEVFDRFWFAAEQMASMARKAGVPIAFMNVPVKLRLDPEDCRWPYAAEPRPDQAGAARMAELEGLALRLRSQTREAAKDFELAMRLDPTAARHPYRLAQALGATDAAAAVRWYEIARDRSPRCTDRAAAAQNAALRVIALRGGARFIDVVRRFEEFGDITNDPVYGALFYDYVHPSRLGQEVVAQGVLRALAHEGLLR